MPLCSVSINSTQVIKKESALGRKRKNKPVPYQRKINKLARLAGRSVGWWKDITDGWDKLSTSFVKMALSLSLLGLVFNPDATVAALIQYGPLLRTTFST
jgi:hypothetical protein